MTNATFAVVDNNNDTQFQSSEDGTSWVLRSGIAARYSSVIWCGATLTQFLAINGNGGTSNWATSFDGHSWAAATVGYAGAYSAGWSEDQAIAVVHKDTSHASKELAWSTDLTTWTTVTADATNNVRPSGGSGGHSIAWSKELAKFCAVGSASGDHQYTTSSDGKTWASNTAAAYNGTSIAWGGDGAGGGAQLFIAVGTGGNVKRSANGTSWTAETFATSPGNTTAEIAYSPSLDRFVVVGFNGTCNTREGASSTWTDRSGGSGLSSHSWQSVCWSPVLSLFVAVAAGGQVATSPDGITWTDRTSAGSAVPWASIATASPTAYLPYRDGHAVSSDTNNVSSKTVTLTTTLTDDIVYLIVHQSDLTNNRTVSSVSDVAGLTWNLRTSSHHQAVSGATSWNNIDLYWAHAPAALTGDVITVTMSGSSDHLVLEAVAFNGVNTTSPFDPNAGLPYVGFNGTNSNALPTISGGVTTTNSHDALIAIYAANENFALTSLAASLEPGVSGAPGGYTATDDFSPGSGSLWERLNNAYKVINAPISAQAHTIGNNSNHTLFIVDALTSDSASDDSTITQTLQSLTQSAHAYVYKTSIAQTLAPLTQAMLCSVSPRGAIAQTLQKLTQNAIVSPGANTINQTLSALSQEADIRVASSTHISQTLQRLTQLLNVAVPVTSTIAQTLQKITQVVTANTPPRFRIAQTLQPVIQLMQETEHVPHFVNAGVQQHFLSSTVTPPLPASLVVGNLLIAFVYFQDGSGFTATWPAGWTPIDAQQDTNGNAGGAYAYHYVTGGDTAPVISMSAGSDFSAQINQYADVDDTYPVGNFQHTSGFSPDLMSAGLESSGTNSLIVMWNTYRTDPGTDIPGYTLENRQTTSDAMAWFDVVVPNDNTTTASVDQVVHAASNSQWQCFMFELLAPFEGVRVVMHPTEPTDIFAGTLFPTDKGDMNITEPTDTLYHPGDAIFPDAHIGWFVFFPPLGTFNPTEHTDVAHFSVFTPPHGTMNLTEFVDRCHAIGYVPGTATMDMTETADTFAAIGWVPGTADFNPTENKDRFLAIGLGATPPKRRRVFIVT